MLNDSLAKVSASKGVRAGAWRRIFAWSTAPKWKTLALIPRFISPGNRKQSSKMSGRRPATFLYWPAETSCLVAVDISAHESFVEGGYYSPCLFYQNA